jgi:hypothetical protein
MLDWVVARGFEMADPVGERLTALEAAIKGFDQRFAD